MKQDCFKDCQDCLWTILQTQSELVIILNILYYLWLPFASMNKTKVTCSYEDPYIKFDYIAGQVSDNQRRSLVNEAIINQSNSGGKLYYPIKIK